MNTPICLGGKIMKEFVGLRPKVIVTYQIVVVKLRKQKVQKSMP